jgi:hypothetical protein
MRSLLHGLKRRLSACLNSRTAGWILMKFGKSVTLLGANKAVVLQLVIMTWRTHEVMTWERLLEYGSKMTYANKKSTKGNRDNNFHALAQ